MDISINKKIQLNGHNYTEQEAMDLALDCHKAGEYQKAESIYRQVYNINPRNSDTLHLSALILYHYGYPDSAIHGIKRAISLNNAVPQYFYNTGIIWIEKGNLDEARECFQKALDIDPNYIKAKEAIKEIQNI